MNQKRATPERVYTKWTKIICAPSSSLKHSSWLSLLIRIIWYVLFNSLHPSSFAIRSLSIRHWSAKDGNRKWVFFFSLFVYQIYIALHTTKFILLSVFTLVDMISLKIWERQLSWRAKCSLPVSVQWLKNVACLISLSYGLNFPCQRGPLSLPDFQTNRLH